MPDVHRACRIPRDQRGATAVEFAITMPILVMVLLGIVTAGLSYTHGVGLANAVREGARFGATGDSTSASWASDVAARTRTTQFDDSASAGSSMTSVCVQLWKYTGPGTNAGSAVKSTCSAGASTPAPGAPALTMPGKDSYPVVPAQPTTGTAGTCVVRVLAARKYSIVLGVVPGFAGTMKRGSVARYERTTC